MSSVIKIQGMNKAYKKQQVLKDLNWTINQGDIVGLLGVNGAGKSTLLKGLLNITELDSGEITLFDEDYQQLSDQSKNLIGYVPQENDEIPWLSVNDLIKFRKQFYLNWDDEKVTSLMIRWQIDGEKKMAELAPGQVQRVLLLLALGPKPQLIIFDEPAAALDPAGRRDFLKEIVELASDGNITIIFSTHITSDLERIASKVAILHQGTIKYFDELDNIKENVVQLSLFVNNEKSNNKDLNNKDLNNKDLNNKDVNNKELNNKDLNNKELNNKENTDTESKWSELTIPNSLRINKQENSIFAVVSKLDKQWLQKIEQQGVKVEVNAMGLEDIFLELTR